MNTSDTQISKSSLEEYRRFKTSIFHSKSDLLINEKQLREIKEEKFNSLNQKDIKKVFRSLDLSVNKISKMRTKSTYHLIFKVKTNKGSFIIKIHCADNLFDEFSFYIEDRVQKILKYKRLPYVEIVDIDLSKSRVNFEYMVMREAEGKNLEDLYPNVSDSEYEDLGSIFKQIHEIKTTKFGHFELQSLLERNYFVGTQDNWQQFIIKNLDNHINQCLKLYLITKKEAVHIKKMFDENSNLFEFQNPSLLHNDPGFRNIFAQNSRITGVLDWEDSISGDPDFELAFIYSFFHKQEKKFLNFLEGYGKKWEELGPNNKFWLYYLRVVIMKEISRKIQGKKLDKSRIELALSHL